jgi:hypothetical protein
MKRLFSPLIGVSMFETLRKMRASARFAGAGKALSKKLFAMQASVSCVDARRE